MRGRIFLCDWAEAINGKLYAQGMGWNRVRSDTPFSFSLGLLLYISYTETNKPHNVSIRLVTEDGQPFPPDAPVSAGFDVEVGRPPGTKPGEEQVIPFSMAITGVPFPPGAYRWEVTGQDGQLDTATFTATRNFGGP